MASGGYGYGGDGGYDTAYDDEYPEAKPYPHPGTVSVRHLVIANRKSVDVFPFVSSLFKALRIRVELH